ncbi:putative DMT superfamily transporter inner membrane protein [Thalassovita autumnalis]|uniref:DMT superfamily transporter inner membrane protein n=1 Tax=Thalassovita autumnalis TaxID=2072972 RepID=A0A0P1FXU0_9RHOB|nr:EamA family transporter [Thalassovita autumnalis]CUH67700.1 putative DMT superfamily transporter inner membrane protein [Thalassovita autumnalis]CUH74000.1 putative DMT superfamily transporter inner membrane protein [Thalassovita autumnalis]
MTRKTDLMLTALAPAIWGSSYIVTTELLPDGYPLTVAALRALPAGLLLLVLVRQLPPVAWLGRLFILGALNFTLFWAALFVAAYQLPGGVAATLGAIQPLIVLLLAHRLLGAALSPLSLTAALTGILGVALLILGPDARLNSLGVLAALGGAGSMALGVVLTRKWQPPVPPLTFTAWQLTAGGLLLVPLALIFEPAFPAPDAKSLAGLVWLGLIGAALTYYLWFRGIARLGPEAITGLGFLSPLSAVMLGWLVLGQGLSPLQSLGALIVLGSVWAGNLGGRPKQPTPARA